MDHEIAPGAGLGIESPARTLKVSPTPVREAPARLESDGLVVKRALSGYRATELLTRQGLEELLESLGSGTRALAKDFPRSSQERFNT